MKNCVECGVPLTSTRSGTIYCNRKCGMRAYHKRRHAEGMYDRRIHKGTCIGCGSTFKGRKGAKYCTQRCSSRTKSQPLATAAASKKNRRPRELKACPACLTLHMNAGRCCSVACSRKQSVDDSKHLRSDLRAAYEDTNYPAFLAALEQRVEVVDECWVWPKQSKDGYPTVRWAGRNYPLHRLVLEAKHGAPLGSQAAHHKCGRAGCVNPDHLQPVTHAVNTAEMLARHSYLNRIAELEAALAQLAPDHPLLNVIAYSA